ncbi:cytochrome P450 [Aspergillus egyptiacus]|nr:cytochrome P450 [Aspergillus egyptiacus]
MLCALPSLFTNIYVASVTAGAAFIYYILIRPLFKGLRHVPGPWISKITTLHLTWYDWQLNRNEHVLEWHRQYGHIVRVSPDEVSVASLDAIRQVYGSSSRWEKSSYFDHFTGYNERSVFATKPHDEHTRRRRLTATFYQASSLFRRPEVEGIIHDRVHAVQNLLDRNQGIGVDVLRLTSWYATDIITHLVLGPNHCTRAIDQPGAEREILQELKYMQLWGPIKLHIPILFRYLSCLLCSVSSRWKCLLADDHLSDWCYSRFSSAVQDPQLQESPSLIKHLMDRQKDPRVGHLSQSYIAAEVLDNINAAEATVAVTSTYLLWQLSQCPDWQRRVREELLALPMQPDGLPSFADINRHAPTLEACLKEIYRLHPATSGRAERIVPEGGRTLCGIYLPAGTKVTSSIGAMHSDPDIFPAPDRYLPGRWLEGTEEELKEREARLIPFGHGARICLGKALATMEIKLLVAGLVLRNASRVDSFTTPESMEQCSTHDAMPRTLQCGIRFCRL